MMKDVIFSLPAEALEGAREAVLLGDFNNWIPGEEFKLKQQDDGSLQTVVKLETGKTYEYRFLLDDGRWVNDYNAQHYIPVSGLYVENCVITVPEEVANDEQENEFQGNEEKIIPTKASPKKQATKPAKESSAPAAPKKDKAAAPKSAAPKAGAKKSAKKSAVKKEPNTKK